MLELAYFNQAELQKQWTLAIVDQRMQFALPFPIKYQLHLDETNYSSLQSVSKNSQNIVVGYYEAQLDRYNNIVENLFLMKFSLDNTFVFVKDSITFISELFVVHGFDKVIFQVNEKNPVNLLFKRYIEKKEVGSKVGTFKEHKKNIDGSKYDIDLYEIYGKAWINNIVRQEPLLHK